MFAITKRSVCFTAIFSETSMVLQNFNVYMKCSEGPDELSNLANLFTAQTSFRRRAKGELFYNIHSVLLTSAGIAVSSR
jgi:hypothetical protein